MAKRVVLALVADLHCRADTADDLRRGLEPVSDEADILVLGGDLCNMGREEEGRALQGVLAGIRIPMVGVLGNHDCHSGQAGLITRMLEDTGVCVLQGDSCRVAVNGASVGFAGAKGFCGGFGTYCLTPFGEDEIKRFVGETRSDARKLDDSMAALRADFRVTLLHYAPIRDTLFGEPAELYPFLGSSILSDPIDKHGCDLVVHGHAHHGVEDGETQGGIPVKNVAMPVIKRPYVVYALEANGQRRNRKRNKDGSS
ncbi:MAG: metallophosphoesterase [Armatimonadetes bacterium]|nr:metallophosphoesterase [Armatimonadota bacterium]